MGASNMYSRISSGILKIALTAMLICAGGVSSFAQQNKQNDDDLSAPEAIALGILALGAGILASEIDKEFFKKAPAPSAPTNGQGPMITVDNLTVRSLQSTIGIGGDEVFLLASNGQRIPSNPNNARDINAGEEWTPRTRLSAPGKLVIELREWDSFNASDVIDRFQVDSSNGPGRYTVRLEGDGGVYEVSYNVSFGGQAQRPQGQARPNAPRQRRWGTHTNGGTISVADCSRDCGETINFLMVCQGNGRPALVNLPSIGSENGPAGAIRPVNIMVGGQRYSYQARLGRPGLFGHVPSLQINPNDPVIEAMQGGRRVQVEFDGQRHNFGLRGSRKALDDFKANCGWTGATAQQQPAGFGRGPVWFASQYTDDRTGQRVSALTYGIPESDATAVHASCVANGAITLDVLGGTGGMQNGAPVALRIGIGNRSQQYDGQVFYDSSEWSGIRVRMNAADPVWRAMQTAPNISFGLTSGGQKSLPGQGAGQAVAQFLSSCAY